MARGFSDREKDSIRAALLEKGRSLFETFGLRRTNVEDLTRAAGISKGAFYLFYDSKEELYMEVLEQVEAEYRERILKKAVVGGVPAREAMRSAFREAFSAWRTLPLFKTFNQEEYEHLLRKLPPEKILSHTAGDTYFVSDLLAEWKKAGLQVNRDPQLVAGLSKALFFASMHEQEIGPEIYPAVLDTLIDLFVDYLVDGNHANY